jgi:lipoprotein-anchoring transpeptidase ErfK/SrfK
MTRGMLVALALAGLATAAAAAWSSRITDRPPAAISQLEDLPAWADSERTFLTKAQVFQAQVEGALDRDVESVLNVRKRMQYGEFVWNDRNVPRGPVWVRVDLKSQLLSVFRSGHEIGTAVILYGAQEKETPDGVFPVLAKIKDHRSATYDGAPMPYTLRLTGDGVAIHGSDVRSGAATHGCIGVPLPFAAKLFEQVSKGDQVVIVSGSGLAQFASH